MITMARAGRGVAGFAAKWTGRRVNGREEVATTVRRLVSERRESAGLVANADH